MCTRSPDEEWLGYTPEPEGPLPGPPSELPPVPLPRPIPLPRPPWPWPDWWRCRRLGPVSGHYEGLMTAPAPGARLLDLRVDLDPRYANSPVLDRVSGDLYSCRRIALPGRPPVTLRVYTESWIVDEPTVRWSRCRVDITGKVRFWKGVHPPTVVQVRIPWGTFTAAGPAEATFTEVGGSTATYVCNRRCHCFHDVTLEVDVCKSVNVAPLLPSYDTHWHPTRPADLPQRTLTIEESYRETGVCMAVRPEHSIVDDSDPKFATWSVAELHDAMETYFSEYPSGWPKWQLWGFLAGTFDSSGVAGIMFDAAAAYGGAGEPPERQGFAVFRNHQWFSNLVAGTPANDTQAAAMRDYLYCWVHEAGHAFNLLHSWDKSRPDALSWMNYPWRYDQRNGANSFWANFGFRFDDEELLHLRHGDRASIIMGGDPWASGGHLEAPPAAMAQVEGEVPVELLLRSKEHFEFMEPVVIELRLRNLLEDAPIPLDTRLNPEFGGVIVYIRRPDGRAVEYAPIACKLGLPDIRTLQPSKGAPPGADRYSEDVLLSYGTYGFYFDQPGEYLVRALYQGAGDLLVASNTHRLRVANPASTEEDRLAHDFFTYQVGMSLYVNGSRSPFLEQGMKVLASVAERYPATMLGAKAALILASSFGRPFFRVQKGVLTQTHSADPKQALALTEAALGVYKEPLPVVHEREEKIRSLNIGYHDLVRTRADYLKALGQGAKAKQEVAAMRKDLAARGVNETILTDIRAYEESI